jgi:hypothetical protein
MAKKRTKAQKFEDFADAYKCVREGKKVKRSKFKDGSIATRPIVPVPDIPEAEVLTECLSWLRKQRIKVDRHDCGAGDFGHGFAKYGIRGAGDLIGWLPNGIHFEIECKRGRGGKLNKAQQKRQRDARLGGVPYLVVHGLLELKLKWKQEVEPRYVAG